jgi:type II secretory pathway pseudopilin PulG
LSLLINILVSQAQAQALSQAQAQAQLFSHIIQLADYSGNNSIPNTHSNPQKEENTNKPFANDLFKPL